LHAHQGKDAEDWVLWVDPNDSEAVNRFLAEVRPDAILCANDHTAALLLRTLSSINVQVPGQIRIAGIDDVKYAQLLQTPLTTIRQPCLEIGATALMAMLDRLAHPTAPSREFIVDFELVVRKSTEVEKKDNTRHQPRTEKNRPPSGIKAGIDAGETLPGPAKEGSQSGDSI